MACSLRPGLMVVLFVASACGLRESAGTDEIIRIRQGHTTVVRTLSASEWGGPGEWDGSSGTGWRGRLGNRKSSPPKAPPSGARSPCPGVGNHLVRQGPGRRCHLGSHRDPPR